MLMKKLLSTLLFLIPSLGFGLDNPQNYLINGGFDFWQRGSTNTYVDGNGYLADRWFATAGTYDQNSSNLPTGQKYGAQLAFSSSSGWLCQRVESYNIQQFEGQKMTVSGWERSSTGTGAFKLKIDYPNTIDNYSGWGKNGTTLTNAIPVTTLLSSTSTTLTQWRYTFTVSTNMATNGFQVCLGTDSSTTTTYQISAVMLNEGFKKQPFKRAGMTYNSELSLAQRYYEKSYNPSEIPGQSYSYNAFYFRITYGNGSQCQGFPFKVTKRRVPDVTMYNAGATTPNQVQRITDNAQVGASPAEISSNSVGKLTLSQSGDWNNTMQGHYTADAEL